MADKENFSLPKEDIEKLASQEEKSFEADPANKDAVIENIIEDESNSMYEPESFEDDYDSDGLLTDAQYDVPESADAFVDTGDGTVIKKEDMTPFEIIKALAKENGTKIKNPSKGCKHCLGRGFDGVDSKTKMPFPCRCLFRGRDDSQKMSEAFYDATQMNRSVSRDQKRRMAKFIRNQFRKQNKILKRRLAEGKPIEEEPKKPTNYKINKVLKEYIKLNSIKKTASSLKLTLTETKKIIKENRKKLEKMLTKKEKK